MADISQLSDEELMGLAMPQPATAAPAAPPISALTDAELAQHQAAVPQQRTPLRVLPFSMDEQGGAHFDIHAGITGALLDAFTAPSDVWSGKLDPTSPEGQQRALNFATMASPMSPAMRAGVRMIPGEAISERRTMPAAPTAEELKSAASEGYDAARATGAQYPGSDIGNLATTTKSALENDGILSELAPQTFSVLGRLENPPQGSVVTIGSLDAVRKSLNRIAGNFGNPTEQEAARRVIARIDQHIQDAGASSAAATGTGSSLTLADAGAGAPGANGTGASALPENPLVQAARLIQEARANAAAKFRSDRITGAEDSADLRAAAANSGQNFGNTMRSRIASILISDKQSRGFAPDELAAMRQVVEGTASSNMLRRVSNLLGGGGGVGHSVIAGMGGAIGAALGGGVEGAGIGAAAASTAGTGSRLAYNALVRRQVAEIDNLLRQRSPLYQSRLEDTLPLPSLRDMGLGLGARGILLSDPLGMRRGYLDPPQ